MNGASGVEEAVYEFVLMKDLQIVYLFTHANVFYRNAKLIGDANHHTAFGRSIELG
jgi:hypothetical protein